MSDPTTAPGTFGLYLLLRVRSHMVPLIKNVFNICPSNLIWSVSRSNALSQRFSELGLFAVTVKSMPFSSLGVTVKSMTSKVSQEMFVGGRRSPSRDFSKRRRMRASRRAAQASTVSSRDPTCSGQVAKSSNVQVFFICQSCAVVLRSTQVPDLNCSLSLSLSLSPLSSLPPSLPPSLSPSLPPSLALSLSVSLSLSLSLHHPLQGFRNKCSSVYSHRRKTALCSQLLTGQIVENVEFVPRFIRIYSAFGGQPPSMEEMINHLVSSVQG